MHHPFLIGTSIYLRSLQETDLSAGYFEWFNDQEVCRYNGHGCFPNTMDGMKSFWERCQSADNGLVLAVVTINEDHHIGNIALQRIDWISRSAEYAVIFGEKDYWGKGFAREASALILTHGFCRLNLNRIYCGTAENNISMQKLALWMGMKQEGRRRQAIYKNGQFRDILEYGVLAREYNKMQKNK